MTINQPLDAVSIILKHIRFLAMDIGPRGSTTEGERRGADYCRETFSRLGLKPSLESYTSAVSIFDPHILSSVFYLFAFILYPNFGRIGASLAALLSLVTLASELLELDFRGNLLRSLVPVGKSQNVFAVVPPSGEHRHDLVLIGHIDTQHTPIIFRTPRWVEVYKGFTTVAFALFVWQGIIFLLGAIFQWTWVLPVTIPCAMCALVLLAIGIEADRSPFTAGANDNASAVGMVLELAEELAQTPLQHTRVYCVCTGCEEVQHYGAIDFFKRHRQEMKEPHGLVFELLGCAGPGWLTTEGIIIPFHSDPGLQELSASLSQQHPEWGAYPVKINGGNTEMADCLRAGVPAITIFGLTRTGVAPYWHQVGDTFDKMDPEILRKTHAMTRAMIDSLDSAN